MRSVKPRWSVQPLAKLVFNYAVLSKMIGPDGQFLVISNGCYQMTDAEGNNIENGVPVDVELVVVDADGKKDYSAFYDIGRLSEVMHGLYSE